jgi:putative toxin-antitoxin system antitoxin component (TIGR02293 family)
LISRSASSRQDYISDVETEQKLVELMEWAEAITRATTLFGSRAAAEQWLEQPAIGLDQRRPIDLMATPSGVELVEDYLGRIEYGVYT